MNKQIYILYSDNRNDFLSGIQMIEDAGLRIKEIYTPVPINSLQESKFQKKTIIPVVGLIFGFLGGTAGFYFQYWVNVIAYPLNFGGKPLIALPSFIPVIFESAMLCSALAMAVVFLFKRNRKNHIVIDKLLAEDQFVIQLNEIQEIETELNRLKSDDTFMLKVFDTNE